MTERSINYTWTIYTVGMYCSVDTPTCIVHPDSPMACAKTSLITLGFSDRNLSKRIKGTPFKVHKSQMTTLSGTSAIASRSVGNMSNACGLVRSEKVLPAAAASEPDKRSSASSSVRKARHERMVPFSITSSAGRWRNNQLADYSADATKGL
jgi:hypothetical protein